MTVDGMVIGQRPASVGQRILWTVAHQRDATLSCPLVCRITGPFDAGRMLAALAALSERHDSLRTTFTGQGHRLKQLVRQSAPAMMPIVPLIDASALPDAIALELRQPLDPVVTSWRAVVWRISDTEHVLCLNMHHLITDAWSCGVLYAELQALYDGATLAPPAATFQEFVDAQTAAVTGSATDRQREYWRRKLAGARVLNLPPSPDADPLGAGRPGVVTIDLPPEVSDRVAGLARELRTTTFVVLLAAYYAHLSVVSGRDDLVVATMSGNRLNRQFQGVVGFLANMVLLRTDTTPAETFADLITLADTTVVGAFAHQELPLQLLATASLSPDGGRVDDLVFQMATDHRQRGHAGGADFELIRPEPTGSRFRLELVVTPVDDGLRVLLYHRTDHLSEAAACAFIEQYADVVDALSAAPHHRLPERST